MIFSPNSSWCRWSVTVVLLLSVGHLLHGQEVAAQSKPIHVGSEYVLGPEDVIKIWALGMEEISDKPVRIDPAGYIDLPVLGRIVASGLSLAELHQRLVTAASSQVKAPMISIDIVEFGSQPVSVMGAVSRPGVHQLHGRKNLTEVLALAGGLGNDAGPMVNITRDIKWGPIPLAGAKTIEQNRFSVAELKLADLMSATKPSDNIAIFPHDVISVPKAELVYVIGAVRKPGAFPLRDKETLSILQALSMSEGLGTSPAASNSKILRASAGSEQRQEIPVDIKRVLAGKAEDIGLRANDVLFIPDSSSKQVAKKALDTALQTLTGLTIWGRRF